MSIKRQPDSELQTIQTPCGINDDGGVSVEWERCVLAVMKYCKKAHWDHRAETVTPSFLIMAKDLLKLNLTD